MNNLPLTLQNLMPGSLFVWEGEDLTQHGDIYHILPIVMVVR